MIRITIVVVNEKVDSINITSEQIRTETAIDD